VRRSTVDVLGVTRLTDAVVGSYPTLIVAGRHVRTNKGTKFKWSDGSSLNPKDIKVGDKAYVEGWKKPGGAVKATKVKVDCNY
jgi:hypothetical protein